MNLYKWIVIYLILFFVEGMGTQECINLRLQIKHAEQLCACGSMCAIHVLLNRHVDNYKLFGKLLEPEFQIYFEHDQCSFPIIYQVSSLQNLGFHPGLLQFPEWLAKQGR